MVRRIVPDPDFESDGDLPNKERSAAAKASAGSPSSSRAQEMQPPTSTRKVVRSNKALQPEPWGTYDYDSDIYTEDSSMGSFIVYSDGEEPQEEQVDSSG
jgi:hypothetical protein